MWLTSYYVLMLFLELYIFSTMLILETITIMIPGKQLFLVTSADVLVRVKIQYYTVAELKGNFYVVFNASDVIIVTMNLTIHNYLGTQLCV